MALIVFPRGVLETIGAQVELEVNRLAAAIPNASWMAFGAYRDTIKKLHDHPDMLTHINLAVKVTVPTHKYFDGHMTYQASIIETMVQKAFDEALDRKTKIYDRPELQEYLYPFYSAIQYSYPMAASDAATRGIAIASDILCGETSAIPRDIEPYFLASKIDILRGYLVSEEDKNSLNDTMLMQNHIIRLVVQDLQRLFDKLLEAKK